MTDEHSQPNRDQQSIYGGGYSPKAVAVLRLVREGKPYSGTGLRQRAGRSNHLAWLRLKGLIERGTAYNWQLTVHGKRVLEYYAND